MLIHPEFKEAAKNISKTTSFKLENNIVLMLSNSMFRYPPWIDEGAKNIYKTMYTT
jgi:hypothetical protein